MAKLSQPMPIRPAKMLTVKTRPEPNFPIKAGADIATFCAVQRPADHPLRPADYRALDAFWISRGYGRVQGLTTSFDWLDIGDAQETPHPMQFWARDL